MRERDLRRRMSRECTVSRYRHGCDPPPCLESRSCSAHVPLLWLDSAGRAFGSASVRIQRFQVIDPKHNKKEDRRGGLDYYVYGFAFFA